MILQTRQTTVHALVGLANLLLARSNGSSLLYIRRDLGNLSSAPQIWPRMLSNYLATPLASRMVFFILYQLLFCRVMAILPHLGRDWHVIIILMGSTTRFGDRQ
jgi:hypothetical protein